MRVLCPVTIPGQHIRGYCRATKSYKTCV